MALSTSFTGGWYFYGQFFDHAVPGFAGTEEIAKHCRERTDEDVRRSRGRFQVFVTADSIISRLAQELVTEDNEGAVLRRLREEIEANNIDWKPDYLDQLLAEREELPEWQDHLDELEAAEQRAWFKRRQESLRRSN